MPLFTHMKVTLYLPQQCGANSQLIHLSQNRLAICLIRFLHCHSLQCPEIGQYVLNYMYISISPKELPFSELVLSLIC